MDLAERLGVDPGSLEDLEGTFRDDRFRGLPYRHLPDYASSLERGTAIVDHPDGDPEVVRGFPKVPRTLVLETGVPRQFEDGSVAVEEKLNGYNVRVAPIRRLGPVAFTRGGIACPFTTAKLRDWHGDELADLFADRPGAMVCGEVIGPENPYTTHDYPEVDSLAFRAFDVRDRETGDPLAVEERRALCSAHGLPQTPLLGTYDRDEAAGAVAEHVAELSVEGREGVVLKSADGRRQLKYTTSAANTDDLAYAFSVPFDYGRDFVFRRLVREAFHAVESGERGDELAARADRIGERILLPMVETIREVDAGGLAGERHTVRGQPAVVAELLAHLRGQGLRLEIQADCREGDERVVTFLKVMRSSTDRTQAYLEGKIVRE